MTNQFLNVENQHARLKVKILRENHTPFVDKQIRKEIYKRSKPRKKNAAKIRASKMQPYIRNKEINVCLCVEDVLKTISLR